MKCRIIFCPNGKGVIEKCKQKHIFFLLSHLKSPPLFLIETKTAIVGYEMERTLLPANIAYIRQ